MAAPAKWPTSSSTPPAPVREFYCFRAIMSYGGQRKEQKLTILIFNPKLFLISLFFIQKLYKTEKAVDSSRYTIVKYQYGNIERRTQQNMQVLNKECATTFIQRHRNCSSALSSLILEIEQSSWKTPHELKSKYPTASIVGDGNVILNIYGNRYRIWLIISYQSNIAMIKKIGTHKEYDNWEIK